LKTNHEKKKLNSKGKGNRVENEFAKVLSERFNIKFFRVPMSGGFSTVHKYDDLREDAREVLSGDLVCPKNFTFSVECKGRADFNFWDLLNENNDRTEVKEWILQAEMEAELAKKKPLVLVKVNNRQPFAIFPREIHEAKLTYGKYSILRFDYFLQLEDKIFFNE
jgi:hypothetical protein